MKKRLLIVCCALCSLMACNSKTDTGTTLSGLKKADFDTTVSGKKVALYELKNKNGVEVAITNYGGRIVSIWVPDRNGKFGDIMLAHSSIADYIADQGGNFGALIGRYGNRINQGRFILDGQEYQLPQNNYGHCLHGGDTGFHHRIWDATQPNAQTLVLSCVSPDGEAGFPGTLKTTVTYSLSDDNALQINYEAETDKPTIVNLTNHAYFNLSGDGKTTILDHQLTLNADYYTPVDSTFMTTGEIAPVEGTPMDFRAPHTVGERIDDKFQQLIFGAGYDHCYVLNKIENGALDLAATCKDPESGRIMEVYTTEAGVQLYTGNWLNGFEGAHGATFPARSAICFEAQCFPDTPNKPHFPSATLLPGDEYQQITVYKFTVEE